MDRVKVDSVPRRGRLPSSSENIAIRDNRRRHGECGSLTCQLAKEGVWRCRDAADFIGRGHKFVLNQLARQVGTSDTTGTTVTWAAATTDGI